jgi:hypothetical protein
MERKIFSTDVIGLSCPAAEQPELTRRRTIKSIQTLGRDDTPHYLHYLGARLVLLKNMFLNRVLKHCFKTFYLFLFFFVLFGFAVWTMETGVKELSRHLNI